MNHEENCGTHETKAVFKIFVFRDIIQQVDDAFKPPKQSCIALPGFFKRLGLFLKYIKDRIAVTAIDPGGEWVFAEKSPKILPIFLGVLRRGSTEEFHEVERRGGCVRRRGHGIMGEMSDVLSEEREGDGRSKVFVQPHAD